MNLCTNQLECSSTDWLRTNLKDAFSNLGEVLMRIIDNETIS